MDRNTGKHNKLEITLKTTLRTIETTLVSWEYLKTNGIDNKLINGEKRSKGNVP